MPGLNKDDIVTCFVFGSKKIKRLQKKKGSSTVPEIIVKSKVFEPSRKTNNLSVSQITDLKSSGDERSIWFIGKVVEKERNARGDPVIMASRADISVSVILDLKLDVIPDIPPPRHANITNFPPVDPEESYTKLQIQQKLADKAEGFLVKEVNPEITNILNEVVSVKPEFENYITTSPNK